MQKIRLKLTVLSISILQPLIMGASPVLADIKKTFPDIDTSIIMLLVSLPLLFTIPATLLCGKLSGKYSQRKILLFGIALTSISGIIPVFSDNFLFILLSRVFMGIGLGFINPFMASLIVEFFKGGEREQLFGLQSTFVCIGSVTYFFLGGLLGAVNWHYNFLVFLIGILILPLIILYLPDRHVSCESAASVSRVSRYTLFFCLLVFLIAIFASFFTTRLSFLLAEKKAGNAAIAGIVSMFTSVGGLVLGMVYGKLSGKISTFSIELAVCLMGAGTITAGLAHSVGIMMLASALLGTGSTLSVIAFQSKIASISQKISYNFEVAIFMSSINLGLSAAPGYMSVATGLVPSIDNTGLYLLTAALLFTYAILLGLFNPNLKKKLAYKKIGEINKGGKYDKVN